MVINHSDSSSKPQLDDDEDVDDDDKMINHDKQNMIGLLLKDKRGSAKYFEISQWSSSVFYRFRNFMGLYNCFDISLPKI